LVLAAFLGGAWPGVLALAAQIRKRAVRQENSMVKKLKGKKSGGRPPKRAAREKNAVAEAKPPKANIDVSQEKLKPRLVSIAFCEYANETKDKKLNLLGIFDRVNISLEGEGPHHSPPLVVFVRLAETFDAPVDVVAINPAGDIVAGITLETAEASKSAYEAYRQVQIVASIRFLLSGYGLYWFDVSYKNKSLGGTGLVIEPLPQEDRNEHEQGSN
jgi:hypothetical protein